MKTQDRTINLLEEYGELEVLTIAREIGLSYDTISKHLKEMAEEGILLREAKSGKKIVRNSGREINPWNYYYKLNNQ